jgi:hypothetical protein
MQKLPLASILAVSLVASTQAGLVNFTYTQTDSTAGSGTIAPFTFMGHDFTATPLSATVFNPNPGLTPAGFVGAQNTQAGNSDEPNTLVGLLFNGTVTATSTDGWLIDIPLLFVAKQTQAPTDTNDYNWNVAYGDSPANNDDAVTGAAIRFMFLFGRDTVIDATETPNTFQRYTQLNQSFVSGVQDSFTNTDTTTMAVKDATDSGNPAGTDAAGLPLAFYFGWRDTGSLSSGAILVDDFAVGGLLNTDETTLRQIPEPSSALLVLASSGLLLLRRRRSKSS